MKKPIAFIPLFLWICLTCNAQEGKPIRLMLKGQLVPFDSAGVIDLPTYRTIRKKLTIGDQFIASLKKENDSLRQEINLWEGLVSKYDTLSGNQEKFAAENRQSFAALNGQFDKLLVEAEKPVRFYKKPWFWGTVGAIGGFLIGKK